MADPNWKDGDYYGGHLPAKGSPWRAWSATSPMSETWEKVGRRLKENGKPHKFNVDFQVKTTFIIERYFVKRFDANSYLYITKAIDTFDVSQGKNLYEVFKGIKAKVLVLAFKSDWLYPASQSREIVRACKLAGVDTTYCEIYSTYGHDAFLLEVEEETHLVKHFLKRASSG
jgi:homoserine O-acetyltransferase